MRPTPEEDQRLHERLLHREIAATSDLCALYLQPLIQVLKRKFPTLPDPEEVDFIVIDALLDMGQRPERYRPERGTLWGFLYMAAWRDLINLVEKEQRDPLRIVIEDSEDAGIGHTGEQERRAGGIRLDVELLPDSRNRSIEDAVLASLCPDGLPEGLSIEEVQEAVREAFPTKEDQEVLELVLDGVRETGPYAATMGIERLPAAEQRAEVKQRKDAAKLRLKRIGKRLQS